MGRYSYSNRKTVEQCLSLDTNWLNRHGYFRGYRSGTIEWKTSTGEVTNAIGLHVRTDIEESDGYVKFNYNIKDNYSGEQKKLDYKIKLTTTQCNYGGLRYWFICSLSVNDVYCGRRVGKLYLSPGGEYFGCRHCYNLTYKCQKEHDKRVDVLLRQPGLILRYLNQNHPLSTKYGVALKAFCKNRDRVSA